MGWSAASGATTLKILPWRAIRPILRAQKESGCENDDRLSGTRKSTRKQEIQLVVAGSSGFDLGGGSRYGLSRVLAQPDGLAGWRAGIFVSGVLELRRQAAV